MMSEPEAPPTGGQLLEEAAAWFARMRGPEAEASRPEFEAWLRRGALHRQAYNRAAEIFAMGKLLSDEEVLPNPPKPAARPDGLRRPRLLAAVAATLLALVAAAWLALGNAPSTNLPQRLAGADQAAPPAYAARLAAEPGRTRSVPLPDGSAVTLEGGTRLEVLLGPSERRFRLISGKARFEVFHERRPFVVQAGGGRVTAHGTVFDVGLSSENGVTVRLIEGIVDVDLPAPSAGPGRGSTTRRMRPGESLSYAAAAGGSDDTILPPEPHFLESASATGNDAVRDYEAVTVAELIARANRGSDRPIRLTEPALAARHVSGRFRVEDSALLAERLAILFDLDADYEHPHEIVLRPG